MKLKDILLLEYQREVTERSYRTSLLKKYRSSSDNEKKLSDDLAIDKIFSVLEESDPTSNKIYVAWLAREYSRDHIHKLEDLTSTAKARLIKYDKYKRKQDFPSSIKDILKVDFDQFMDGIDSYEIPEDTKTAAKDFKHVFSDDELDVYIPLTWEASVKLGRNTHWCTAADSQDGKRMYNQYTKSGPLYVIIPKHPSHVTEKYQYHKKSGQFMDETDHYNDDKFNEYKHWLLYLANHGNDSDNITKLVKDKNIDELTVMQSGIKREIAAIHAIGMNALDMIQGEIPLGLIKAAIELNLGDAIDYIKKHDLWKNVPSDLLLDEVINLDDRDHDNLDYDDMVTSILNNYEITSEQFEKLIQVNVGVIELIKNITPEKQDVIMEHWDTISDFYKAKDVISLVHKPTEEFVRFMIDGSDNGENIQYFSNHELTQQIVFDAIDNHSLAINYIESPTDEMIDYYESVWNERFDDGSSVDSDEDFDEDFDED